MRRLRNKTYLKRFAKNLRTIRVMKGMTLNDVAHSGTHKQWMELNSYYRIEKGDVNISICTLSAIAKALDIHPSELLKF